MHKQKEMLHFLANSQLYIEAKELLDIFCNQSSYLFIKNEALEYQFANQSFMQLLGVESFKHLMGQTNDAFYSDKKLIKRYRECDEYVLEEQKALAVCEPLAPKLNKNIHKVVQGKLYPICSDTNNVKYVMGVVTPQTKLIRLDWETIFRLSSTELAELLIKRSYSIKVHGYSVMLSRMEIRSLIELFKGKNAGEIADTLCIKQTTVESYLKNIRNKLTVSSKSELINVLIRYNVLQQIVV